MAGTQINIVVNQDSVSSVLDLDQEIRAAMRESQAEIDQQKQETKKQIIADKQVGVNDKPYQQISTTPRKPLIQRLTARKETEDRDPTIGWLDISVIDEDNFGTSFGSTEQRDILWNQYRDLYPLNTFVLLVPSPSDGIDVPSNFFNTNSYRFQVGRNDSGTFTNWVNLLNNEGIRTTGLRGIHLLIDNSGSMTFSTVAQDATNFLNNLNNETFIPTGTWEDMYPYENWIQMHIDVVRD